jgi:hypothetical protein
MNDADQSTYDSHCPECGAIVGQGVERCWLCGWQRESDSSAPAESVPPPVAPRPVDQGFSYSLETMMLVTTLVAVGMGAIVLFPGIGIILAIMLLPAFVRTSKVIRRRAEQGRTVGLWPRVALFFGSFTTALVIIVVVSVASVGTFCGLCLGFYFVAEAGGLMRSSSSEGLMILAMVVSGIAALAATIAAGYYIVKWIRRRWQRDTKID